MDNSTMAQTEGSLLNLMLALKEQQAEFSREAKKLTKRCQSEHGQQSRDAKKSDRDKADKGGQKKDKKSKPADGKDKDYLCRACSGELLTLVHTTYASPKTQPQWFSAQQTTLVAELDRRLDEVRHMRAPLASVEAWLEEKKRAWIMSRIRDNVGIQALGVEVEGSKAGFQEKLAKAAAEAVGADEAGAETGGGPGAGAEAKAETKPEAGRGTAGPEPLLREWLAKKGESAEAEAKATVEKLKAAAPDVRRQGAIQREVLFPSSSSSSDNTTTEAAAAATAVPSSKEPVVQTLEKKLLDGAVGLEEGLREAVRALGLNNFANSNDDEAARAAQIEKHRKRLAELRRAKAAHEAEQLKRTKPPEVPYFLRDEAQCATCGQAADPQKRLFCVVCFLEVEYCLRETPTVWCSATCMAATFNKHFADHPCRAGNRCARTHPEPHTVRQEPRFFFCRECVLSFSIDTFYCNERCAGRDFQQHREQVHLPNRRIRNDEYDEHGDQDDLSYSQQFRKSYTAADIMKHLLPMSEAMASCQKKHPDWKLDTDSKVTVMMM